jgi:hypothetical protein
VPESRPRLLPSNDLQELDGARRESRCYRPPLEVVQIQEPLFCAEALHGLSAALAIENDDFGIPKAVKVLHWPLKIMILVSPKQ